MSLGKNQILSDTRIESALDGFGVMRPQKKNGKKDIVSGVTLTSLVDCFTILVVYLLVTTSMGAEELNVPKGMQLPRSQQSDVLESGVVLNYQNKRFSIDDKPVRMDDLIDALKKIKDGSSQKALIIQADKSTTYADLNPAVLSGLQAGFEKIRFAVMKEDGK